MVYVRNPRDVNEIIISLSEVRNNSVTDAAVSQKFDLFSVDCETATATTLPLARGLYFINIQLMLKIIIKVDIALFLPKQSYAFN